MSKSYYELTYIINPVLEDDQYEEIVGKFTDFIKDNDGEIDEVDEWGIRKFEYEMDGKTSGYYVNVFFDAPGDLIEKLERAMRIDDNIMRYLTLKYDAKMLRHRELQKKNAVPDIFAFDDEEDQQSDEDED
ncbi:MAG: 30S ribosomal protein S6 [Balneolaceae bacterium]|nr:30S ribosomal protein S6 [Balneolaceae bacterium]